MKEAEVKSEYARKEARAGNGGGLFTGGSARLAAGERTGMVVAARAHRSTRPITFNGLLTNKLLTALPGEDFARLLPHLSPVTLSSGDHLYEFENSLGSLYFPETAVVSHLSLLEDSSMSSVDVIGREGVVGFSRIFNAHSPAYLTQVTIGGIALKVGAEIINREFARGGTMQRLLLRYISTRLAQLSQRVVCIGRHRLDERLCTWLLEIHDRAGNEQLPLTHEEIGHHLGARRAGITTACNMLRSHGTINYRRGMVYTVDRQRLESLACECYRAAKQRFEHPV